MKAGKKYNTRGFDFGEKKDFDKYRKFFVAEPHNRINEIKFQVLFCLLRPILEGSSILDLGCGEAFYADYLIKNGARHFLGIDKSSHMIELAREGLLNKEKKEFIVGDMLKNNLWQKLQYDIILSIFSLMRAPSIKKLFKSISVNTKKGGTFVIMTNTYEMNDHLIGKRFIVKIKKNRKIFLNNYPRVANYFIREAASNGFELVYSFFKPFSKDKKIIYPSPKNIKGFDTILFFIKQKK